MHVHLVKSKLEELLVHMYMHASRHYTNSEMAHTNSKDRHGYFKSKN